MSTSAVPREAAEPAPVSPLISTGAGDLFRVPPEDWTALSKRVGKVGRLRPIAAEVSRWLPGFDDLLEACDAWRTTTFPAIVNAANGLRDYAAHAVQEFTAIQDQLPSRGQPISPVSGSALSGALDDLSARTTQLSGQFAGLTTPVARFSDANQLADANIQAVRDRLGADWSSVLPQSTSVRNAAGRVRGIWSSLADDLAARQRGHVDLSAEFVAGLQIASAIIAWRALGAEADAFARSAPEQNPYLSGQWLEGTGPVVGR